MKGKDKTKIGKLYESFRGEHLFDFFPRHFSWTLDDKKIEESEQLRKQRYEEKTKFLCGMNKLCFGTVFS